MNLTLRDESYCGVGSKPVETPFGLDLFWCRHHRHRVTSFECVTYHDNHRCPESCDRWRTAAVTVLETDARHEAFLKSKEGAVCDFDTADVVDVAGVKMVVGLPPRKGSATPLIGPDGAVAGQICNRCGKPKPLAEFYKSDTCNFGHLHTCKDCVKNRNYMNYLRHRAANQAEVTA